MVYWEQTAQHPKKSKIHKHVGMDTQYGLLSVTGVKNVAHTIANTFRFWVQNI
jgi:hypothetical protein